MCKGKELVVIGKFNWMWHKLGWMEMWQRHNKKSAFTKALKTHPILYRDEGNEVMKNPEENSNAQEPAFWKMKGLCPVSGACFYWSTCRHF